MCVQQSKKKGKDHLSIQSSTTPDQGYQWESNNFTIRHHKREVSPFPAGDHKASINRRARKHNKHKTEKHKWSTKEAPPWNGQLKYFTGGLKSISWRAHLTHLSEDSNHSAHALSMIRIFVLRLKKRWTLGCPMSAHRKLRLRSVIGIFDGRTCHLVSFAGYRSILSWNHNIANK